MSEGRSKIRTILSLTVSGSLVGMVASPWARMVLGVQGCAPAGAGASGWGGSGAVE